MTSGFLMATRASVHRYLLPHPLHNPCSETSKWGFLVDDSWCYHAGHVVLYHVYPRFTHMHTGLKKKLRPHGDTECTGRTKMVLPNLMVLLFVSACPMLMAEGHP